MVIGREESCGTLPPPPSLKGLQRPHSHPKQFLSKVCQAARLRPLVSRQLLVLSLTHLLPSQRVGSRRCVEIDLHTVSPTSPLQLQRAMALRQLASKSGLIGTAVAAALVVPSIAFADKAADDAKKEQERLEKMRDRQAKAMFDPDALERGAKALREINQSSHAKQVRPGAGRVVIRCSRRACGLHASGAPPLGPSSSSTGVKARGIVSISYYQRVDAARGHEQQSRERRQRRAKVSRQALIASGRGINTAVRPLQHAHPGASDPAFIFVAFTNRFIVGEAPERADGRL